MCPVPVASKGVSTVYLNCVKIVRTKVGTAASGVFRAFVDYKESSDSEIV